MDTEFLVQQFLAGGGEIKKLPDGEARGALRCDLKDGIPNRAQPTDDEDESLD